MYKHVENTIYFENHHKILQQCVKNSQVFIACDENDLSQILGYIVADRIDGILTIHYVYVKQAFRGLGIAKLLLEEVGFDRKVATIFTHGTEFGIKLGKYFNCVFHPYVLAEYFKKEGVKEYLEKNIKETRDAIQQAADNVADTALEVIEENKEILEKLED